MVVDMLQRFFFFKKLACFNRIFCHLQLNHKVQSWIYSLRKMLINYKNKRKHDNVKYYKESFKLT